MISLWCPLYLLALLACGYAVVNVLLGRGSKLERAGLAACLGPGIFGPCLIALSLAGIRPDRVEVLALGALFGVAALASWRWRVKRPGGTLPGSAARASIDASTDAPAEEYSKAWTIFCLIAVGYGATMLAAASLFYRTTEWDAYAIWQLKGKVLAVEPMTPRPAYFSDVSLSFSHLRYPVLVPMMSAGMHALSGQLDDDAANSPALLLYLGLGAALYATIRRYNGHTAAITVTALFMNLGDFYHLGGSGTADMPLTAFYGGSIICLLRWSQSRRWGELILAAIFSAAMTWTKNEGLALALINGVVLLTIGRRSARDRWQSLALFAAIVMIVYLPWLLYMRGLPRTDEDYAGRLNPAEILAHLSRLPTIVWNLLWQLMSLKMWGIFWYLPPVLTLLNWRRLGRQPIAMLWLLLVLQTLAYVPPYMVAPVDDLASLMNDSSDRLMLHATPAGMLLIGLLWPARKKVAA